MAKWTLPEGRKPLTDADIAALTRRLAGTAVDYKELYEAAKRDAEEAEAYAASLESDMKALADMLRASKHRNDALEAKLAKAVEALDRIEQESLHYAKPEMPVSMASRYAHETTRRLARATLAELKGQDDE